MMPPGSCRFAPRGQTPSAVYPVEPCARPAIRRVAAARRAARSALSPVAGPEAAKSEEHTSELQSLMRISYAVFCLKKKKNPPKQTTQHTNTNLLKQPTQHNYSLAYNNRHNNSNLQQHV